MYALERPPHLRIAAIDDVQSPRIRQLHDYWKSKCSDIAPPPRSAIEPSEIRPLLPYLTLTELTAEPFGILYRLVGTAVVRAHREDFTGREHGSVESLAQSGLEESYRRVLETKAPIFGRTALDAGDRTWIAFEYAIFPLSDDGRAVNKCLAILHLGETEAPVWMEDGEANPATIRAPQ